MVVSIQQHVLHVQAGILNFYKKNVQYKISIFLSQTGCFTTTSSLFSSWFNGQSSLSYQITNGAIGSDPCPGTVKYSQITFQCI